MLFLRLTHLGSQQGFRVRTVSGRKLTPTVLLVIELILLEQLVPAFLQSSLAPVLCPEHGSRYLSHGFLSCPFYLFQTLPTTGGQCGSKIAEAKFLSLTGRFRQSQRKALLTAQSPLRLVFQPANACTPSFMVIIAINPFQPQALSMALTLVLADLIFLTRPDIGVEIEDGGTHAIRHQPFNNGRRTGCTTSMQQHLVATLRNQNSRLFQLLPLTSYIRHLTSQSPLAFQMRSLAALISWNFFSAALRTSSPSFATRSG